MRARLRAEDVSRSLALSRASLERARAEFEAIFRSMHDTAVFTDTNNLVLYANDALEAQFGYAPHELRGQSVAVLHADGRVDRSSTLERVTTVYRRRNGQRFYGEMQRSAVRNERGEVIGSLEVIHDITERIDAERALKAGERRYQGVLEAVPYPLWVTSNGDEVAYRNAKYQQMFGEAMIRDVLHPEDRPALERAWQASSRSAQTMVLELRLQVEAAYRYFVLVGAPILDAGGAGQRVGLLGQRRARPPASRAAGPAQRGALPGGAGRHAADGVADRRPGPADLLQPPLARLRG